MAKVGTVLILSTYPIKIPLHGGQVRLHNIRRAYERGGWKVASLAVYPEETYLKAAVAPSDLPFPANSPYRLFKGKNVPLINDFLSGSFATAQDGGLPAILSKIPQQIDVIHVEQPWLWPLAMELRKRSEHAHVATIYGSQNIEEPLKRDMLNEYKADDLEEILRAISDLERNACLQADLAIGVTWHDCAVMRTWGAKNVAVVPNGIDGWRASSEKLTEWRARLPRYPWLLYVASAHLPNFTRFLEIFGGSLGCFPPTSRLVVAGGVGEHIHREIARARWADLNLSRLQVLFSLPDEDLAAVKSLAHGFVLPIPYGGGSNIKTAEAIYSGSYVIGTRPAFRGYESFLGLPEVNVVADSASLHRTIRHVLSRERIDTNRQNNDMSLRDTLLWENCLAELPELARNLVSNTGVQ
ncbi:MAG TPA: glycosyltransferase [Rhizobiaceae bacterium]|nr:glycosyltransferase [Rhizobiaceae bacterium]